MLILLFVGIALIIAGAFLFAWIIFVIGFILAIIRFFKARKLFPTDKVCPYCDHTDLSFTHNTSKKGAPTIAVCQNCGQKFDFWTEEEIKKVQKKQLIRMIVFGILTLLTSVMMFAGGGTESDAVEQSAVSEQVPAENNQAADKEEKKASYISQIITLYHIRTHLGNRLMMPLLRLPIPAVQICTYTQTVLTSKMQTIN